MPDSLSQFAYYEYVILCAKLEELAAVISVLRNHGSFKLKTGDRKFDVIFEVSTPSGTKRILLNTCGGMGHTKAAIVTSRHIYANAPSCIFFVGTAASIRPESIQLGDVVIPRKTLFRLYDKVSQRGQSDFDRRELGGKLKEVFLDDNMLVGDTQTVELSHGMQTILASVDFSGIELLSGNTRKMTVGGADIELRSARLHLDEDIITCGMLVDSLSYRDFLVGITLDVSRKASIIDMESFGFYDAIVSARSGPLGSSTDGIMIRGISDYAGRKQQNEQKPEDWKNAAVRNAAEVVARIITTLYGI